MLKFLDHLEEWLIAALMGAATLLIFVSVLHRYGASTELLNPWLAPINMSWAQELCIYMFVWMAKFGAAYGVRTGIHVGVDVLINKLDTRNRNRFIVFGLLAGAVFTATVGSLGANFVWHMSQTDQTSPDLEIKMWIVYLAVPLGSALMCFRFIQALYLYLTTGYIAHHDLGAVDGVDDEADTAAGGKA